MVVAVPALMEAAAMRAVKVAVESHSIAASRARPWLLLIGRVLGSAVGAENVSLSRIQSFRISDVWKDEIPSHDFLILETV